MPTAQIVVKAEEFGGDIIGLSTLLSTTLFYYRDTIRLLEEKVIREKYKEFIETGLLHLNSQWV